MIISNSTFGLSAFGDFGATAADFYVAPYLPPAPAWDSSNSDNKRAWNAESARRMAAAVLQANAANAAEAETAQAVIAAAAIQAQFLANQQAAANQAAEAAAMERAQIAAVQAAAALEFARVAREQAAQWESDQRIAAQLKAQAASLEAAAQAQLVLDQIKRETAAWADAAAQARTDAAAAAAVANAQAVAAEAASAAARAAEQVKVQAAVAAAQAQAAQAAAAAAALDQAQWDTAHGDSPEVVLPGGGPVLPNPFDLPPLPVEPPGVVPVTTVARTSAISPMMLVAVGGIALLYILKKKRKGSAP
jgi:hypothetical protein